MLAVPLLVAGLSGCGGGEGSTSSQCRAGATSGQCVVALTLNSGKPFDYTVGAATLPVLGGAVQVDAFVQSDQAPVRVWWEDAAGTKVTGTASPGHPCSMRGLAVVKQGDGQQRFVVHFEVSGKDSGKVDATISYG